MANESTCIFCVLRDRSLFIAKGGWGGGADNFRGDHLSFRRTKGGSVVTENPKGGSLETLEGFGEGTTQICLENEDMEGRGGSRKTSKVIRGPDHFSEVTFKGEIG